jgi:hypothetical protein
MPRSFILVVLSLAVGCGKTDNTAPVVQIVTPQADAQLQTSTVDLLGNIMDADGEADIEQVEWRSSVDGILLDGSAALPDGLLTTGQVMLSPGNHQITLTVTDSVNDSVQDSVSITVGSTEGPAVSITSPTETGIVDTDTPTTITATVASPSLDLASLNGT